MTPEQAKERLLELKVLQALANCYAAGYDLDGDLKAKLDGLADYEGSLTHLMANLDQAVHELEQEDQPQVRWYPVKWCQVRAGDRIRMQGHEASVLTSTLLRWNVKPGTGTSQYNPPVPEPHVVNNLTSDATDKVLRMGPRNDQTHPVEIQLSEDEHAAIDMLGWENRVRQQ